MSVQNVNSLLFAAYKDAGVIGRDQNMSDIEQSEGLYMLNQLLVDMGSKPPFITYKKSITFSLTANQQEYSIDLSGGAYFTHAPIVKLNWVSINLGNITVPIEVVTDDTYLSTSRIINGVSIPGIVFLTTDVNTSKLTFYFAPSQNNLCTVTGLFQIGPVQGTDLLSTIPVVYQKFLRYALAIEFCSVNMGIPLSDRYMEMYDKLESDIISASQRSFQSKRNPFFQSGSAFNQSIQNGGFD